MKEQIEEMAKDLRETAPDYCESWHCKGCQYEEYGEGYVCDSIQQAEKMIAKGYRKQSGWVSVKERLPEKDGMYIVHTKNLTGHSPLGLNVFVAEYILSDFVFYGWEDNRITHWMPLPEPPKGD